MRSEQPRKTANCDNGQRVRRAARVTCRPISTTRGLAGPMILALIGALVLATGAAYWLVGVPPPLGQRKAALRQPRRRADDSAASRFGLARDACQRRARARGAAFSVEGRAGPTAARIARPPSARASSRSGPIDAPRAAAWSTAGSARRCSSTKTGARSATAGARRRRAAKLAAHRARGLASAQRLRAGHPTRRAARASRAPASARASARRPRGSE